MALPPEPHHVGAQERARAVLLMGPPWRGGGVLDLTLSPVTGEKGGVGIQVYRFSIALLSPLHLEKPMETTAIQK